MGLKKPGSAAATIDFSNITNRPAFEQALAARNVLAQRSAGRKMSAAALGAGMITSLPAYADGMLQTVVGGQTLKNELNYNNITWAELITLNAVGDSSGIEITLSGSTYSSIQLSTLLKNATNYILLCNVVSNSMTTNHIELNNALTGNYDSIVTVGVTGNVKKTFTTQGAISNNIFKLEQSAVSDGGAKIKFKDLRVLEVPVGSQLETDINAGMSADQLAIKYPYVSGASVRSAQAQRVKSVGKNLFDNSKPVFINTMGANIYRGLYDVNYVNSILNVSSTYYTSHANGVAIPYVPYTEITVSFDISAPNNYGFRCAILSGLPDASGIFLDYSLYMTNLIVSTTVSGSRHKIAYSSLPIIAGAKYFYIWLVAADNSAVDGVAISNVMITKGTADTSYEPYAETVTYVPGPLRSVGSVADTVDVRTGRYTNNISDWVTLDGSLNWSFSLDKTGYKRIQVSLTNAIDNSMQVIKYNGMTLVPYVYGVNSDLTPDQQTNGGNIAIITVSDVDTGWTENMSSSNDEIKAYFYGWKMCASDGGVYVSGTKYWKKITDGTGITSTLPTASYAGYTPYKMIYQLATPITTYYKDLGQLDALPNGSIIVEPIVRGVKLPTFGTGQIVATTTDAPISSIESVYHIDTGLDGQQTKVDVTSSFTVDSGGLGITYAGADSTKPYEYVCTIDPAYSTIPTLTYSYPEADALAIGVASHSYASAAADWVMSTAEGQCGVLVCTLASGSANIIAPDRNGTPYWIQNDSGQTLTIKKSGGTGDTIATGKKALFIHTGADYVKFFTT